MLRVKCVCKSWYALINSSNFITEHLNFNKNKRRPQLLIHDRLADLDDSVLITIISEDTIGEYYVDDISLALWNPANREVRPLPAVQFVLPRDHIRFEFSGIFGFRLDPITSNINYKVVWLHIVLEDNIQGDLFPRA